MENQLFKRRFQHDGLDVCSTTIKVIINIWDTTSWSTFCVFFVITYWYGYRCHSYITIPTCYGQWCGEPLSDGMAKSNLDHEQKIELVCLISDRGLIATGLDWWIDEPFHGQQNLQAMAVIIFWTGGVKVHWGHQIWMWRQWFFIEEEYTSIVSIKQSPPCFKS